MIPYFVILVIVCVMYIYILKRRHISVLFSKFPATSLELPVIGVAHKFIGDTEVIMKTFMKLSYESMRLNGPIRVPLLHLSLIGITDPADMSVVLKSSLEKDDLYKFLQDITDNGSSFAPIPIWKSRRKHTAMSIGPKMLNVFVDIFKEHSDKLIETLSSHADRGIFKLWTHINDFSFVVILDAGMGVKSEMQENENTMFLNAMNESLNVICQRMAHIWKQPEFIFKLVGLREKINRNTEFIHNYVKEIVRKRKVELQQMPNKDKLEPQCSLDYFLLNTNLNDVEIKEECIALILGAMDTSATAVGFIFKLLGLYPSVQEKAYAEVESVFNDPEPSEFKEKLYKLDYLDRVIKETIRLFPPAPLIIRKIYEDTKLPSSKVIPAGSSVVASFWGMHRHPKYWGSDAEHFDPDRFIPERFDKLEPGAYSPFSLAPRNCLGGQYSRLLVKTVVSTVLRKYKIVGKTASGPIPEIRVKLDIMLKAVDDFEIALETRRK